MSESGSWHGSWSQRFLSCLLAVALAFTFVFPMIPRTAVADPLPDSSQEARIQELLQGKYTEGRVLVSVSNNAAAASPRSRSLSEGAALLSSAQDLITVTPQEETPAPANGIAPFSLESDSAPSETIKLIESDTLTTEELIRALINEPGVITIEPDYQLPIEKSEPTPLTLEEYTQLANSAPSTRSAPHPSIGQPDFTSLQWAYQPNEEASMHVPGWDQDSSANMQKDVYVAIIDGGVDYNHPDLQGAFTKQLPIVNVAGIESGVCGIDTFDRDNDPLDTEYGHGTHIAGIIAATWNDGGVSGVASRAKLVAVRTGGEELNISSAIMGYSYLKELINKGVPVRVTSNSWGGIPRSTLLQKTIAELGSVGVVSVFASGNGGTDLRDTRGDAAYLSDPYSIVVGASNELGQASLWSSYSTRFVDVYAPGANIFSTYPTALGGYVDNGEQALYWEDYESSTADEKTQPMFIDANANPLIATVSTDVFHTSHNQQPEGGHSIAIDLSTLPQLDDLRATNVVGFLLPRSLVQGAEATSVHVTYVGENASVSARLQVHVDGAWQNGKLIDLLPCAPESKGDALWTEFSVTYPQIGAEGPETEGLVHAYLMIQSDDSTPLEGTLYVDDIAFGSGDTLVPYVYESGTSMAAPAIAGATAVLMARPGYNRGTAEDAALAAATISGSVVQDPSYADRCISSGTFDFECLDNPVPVVRTLELEGDELHIGGYFFGGTTGTVTLTPEGGEPSDITKHITSWTDRSIVISGADIPSGQVTVSVSRSGDSAYGRHTRLLVGETPLYEFDLTSTLPDDPEFAWFEGNTLTALGGKLYLIAFGYRTYYGLGAHLWVFDLATSSWLKMPLPPELANVSCNGIEAVAYQGRLVVHLFQDNTQMLFAFDPVTGEWQEYALPDEISLAASIGVLGDELLFVGGESYNDEGIPVASKSMVAFDLETGQVSPYKTMEEARAYPFVRSNGSTMIVQYGVAYDENGNESSPEALEIFSASEADPSAVEPLSATSSKSRAVGLTLLDFAATQSGMVELYSAPSGDPDTLTWVFGEVSSQPRPERVSPVPMVYATCEVYEGKLYVLGFNDPTAPDGTRVFRATEVETAHNPHTDVCEPGKDPGKDPGEDLSKDPAKDPTSTVDLPTTNPNPKPKPPVATGDSPALPVTVLLALTGLAGVTVAARRRFKKERV